MALIPDEAILRSSEISPIAFRLYCLYCLHRNKESRGWNCSLSQSAIELNSSKSRVSEGRAELITKGWIEIEGSFIIPVVGFKGSENRTPGFEKSNGTVRKIEPQRSESRTKGSESRTLPPDPPNRDNQVFTSPGDQRESVGKVALPLSTPAISKNQIPVSTPEEHPAITIYKTEFGLSPTAAQAQAITATVHDLEHYRVTLRNWQLNGWRPTSVNEQLDRYKRTAPIRNPEPLPEPQANQAALAVVPPQPPTSATLMQFARPGTVAEFQPSPFVIQNAMAEEALAARKKAEEDEYFAQIAAKALARKQQRMIENYGR